MRKEENWFLTLRQPWWFYQGTHITDIYAKPDIDTDMYIIYIIYCKNKKTQTQTIITLTVIYEYFTRLSQPTCQHDIHTQKKGIHFLNNLTPDKNLHHVTIMLNPQLCGCAALTIFLF